MSSLPEELEDAVQMLYEQNRTEQILSQRSVELARTSQTTRTATIRRFAHHEELEVSAWNIEGDGLFYQPRDKTTWRCSSKMGDLAALAALIGSVEPTDPGSYLIIRKRSAAAELVRALGQEGVESAAETVVALLRRPDVVDALSRSGDAVAGAALVTRRRQEEALARLKGLVENPGSSEQNLHDALKDQTWLFGGRYIKEFPGRDLTTRDQMDIPLQRADGSFHIVELKKANVTRPLLREQRNHLIPGLEVHEAVGQTMNYLKVCDDDHDAIRRRLGADTRRATATVVIGHSMHTKWSAEQVANVFRDYSSQLSRIDVISYEELIVGAEAALALDASSSPEEQPEASG